MANARRLPGIQVDVAPPPAVEALPRLDVAVFVGFAATGPLHLPVAIESTAQYATVFGADAPLAWDAERGERVAAHLGPSVRAFFANGGRRCWVTRTARSATLEAAAGRAPDRAVPTATSNRFALPGVLVLSASASAAQAAVVTTRCEGSWSDRLRVDTALQRRSFALVAWSALDSPPLQRFAFTTRQTLGAGDLLQLGDDAALCAYAIVEVAQAAVQAAGNYEVQVRVCAAFERLRDLGSPPLSTGSAQIEGFGPQVAARWTTVQTLQFDGAVPAQLEPGHWVRFDDGTLPVWLRIDEIDRSPAFVGSPASLASSSMHATVLGPAWRELAPALPPALATPRRAQQLELTLRAADPLADESRLNGLGLTPLRAGSFWEQEPDAAFYRVRDGLNAVTPAEQQRFPLAPEDVSDASSPPISSPALAWLPLGVPATFGDAVGLLPAIGSALERDGLSRFGSDLFIDPALADDKVDALLAHADAIRLMDAVPRALLGLHASLGIGAGGLFNEASLLALPDAIHLGWRRRAEDDGPDATPRAADTPPHWVSHRGPCVAAIPTPALDEPDFGNFLDCATRRLNAPILIGPDQPVQPGAYRLAWSDSEPGADYALFEAGLSDFSDEREIRRGADTQYVVLTQREGAYHYRVFAQLGDERSTGSNPVTVRVRADDWQQLGSDAADLALETHWLAVHRAALRLAAASGDLLVVLTMPRHFRTAQALRYTQRLRSVQVPLAPADGFALAANEARALSYGALYFPWLQADARNPASGSGAPTAPLVVPPDGVAMGVLAARSTLRGPWVAAANEPMKEVVALAPPISEHDRQALQDAQINLLRADPRGFFTLSSDTLCLDDDLRPINVRRLLILLRRLALRRGTSYVFEPNGPALRRAVERAFNTVLNDLFERGAFAGATRAQSFRVVTDDTINTAQDFDAGRFFVELRVAPSLPLRFIAVRLAQSGERLSVVEEL